MTKESSPIGTEIIRLKHPKFKDFKYYYGTVKLGNPDELNVHVDSKVRCTYEFFTIDDPNKIDTKDVDFTKLLGDIIVDIVTDEIEADDRANNTE